MEYIGIKKLEDKQMRKLYELKGPLRLYANSLRDFHKKIGSFYLALSKCRGGIDDYTVYPIGESGTDLNIKVIKEIKLK